MNQATDTEEEKFQIHPSNCFAVKVQDLNSETDKTGFAREIACQKTAEDFAPRIISYCKEKKDNKTYGIIVMELFYQELDNYLANPKLENKDLDKVIDGIEKALLHLKGLKMTHGDLALFNIAVDQRGSIMMLDYDRASTEEQNFSPAVDLFRICTECFKTCQSDGTNRGIPIATMRYLSQNGINRWLNVYNQEEWEIIYEGNAPGITQPFKPATIHGMTAIKWDLAWSEAYQQYCTTAGVKCIEIGGDQTKVCGLTPSNKRRVLRSKVQKNF